MTTQQKRRSPLAERRGLSSIIAAEGYSGRLLENFVEQASCLSCNAIRPDRVAILNIRTTSRRKLYRTRQHVDVTYAQETIRITNALSNLHLSTPYPQQHRWP
ncbi:MAG: hypothetical protein M3294_02455, partial [Pseudomonadota bacterium]|nr:hypothetical protein [Pseudomonadota bacterium]